MVVADYAKTGDTMMAALVIAMGLLQSGKKMSEIFPLFTSMTRKRIDSKFCGKDEMLAAFELAAFQAEIKQEKRILPERAAFWFENREPNQKFKFGFGATMCLWQRR